jgi:hypothetical protein
MYLQISSLSVNPLCHFVARSVKVALKPFLSKNPGLLECFVRSTEDLSITLITSSEQELIDMMLMIRVVSRFGIFLI